MRRWPYTFAVILSVVVATIAIVASQILDLPIHSPDSSLGPWFITFPVIVALFFAAGIVPSAIRRGGWTEIKASIGKTIEEDWTRKRLAYITVGLLSFWACYISYRNLKSFLPVVREGVLHDNTMLKIDHFLGFGNYPSDILHNLLGTGVAAYILSAFYLSYLALVPISLGALLVWSKDLSVGAWYATALSLNWVMGVISYYMVPTLGPAFAQPQSFLALPETGSSALQNGLADNRFDFLADPWSSDSIHGIAGFASLHVSVVVAACLLFHRTNQKAILRYASWAYLVVIVVATLYLGWHYIGDDVAGALIGWLSIVIGAWATGNTGQRRKGRPIKTADDEPAHILND